MTREDDAAKRLPTMLYAIGTFWGEPVKLGVAQDIPRRLQTLQAGNYKDLRVLWSTAIADDQYAAETHLHRHFASRRVRGEWFDVDSEEEITSALEGFDSRSVRPEQPEEVEIASAAVSCLIQRIMRRDAVSMRAAMQYLTDKYGIRHNLMWMLRYRKSLKTLWMHDFVAIAKAMWTECGHDWKLQQSMPDPARLFAATRALEDAPIGAAMPIQHAAFEPVPAIPLDRVRKGMELLHRFELLKLERDFA